MDFQRSYNGLCGLARAYCAGPLGAVVASILFLAACDRAGVAQSMPPLAVAPFDATRAKQYQEQWAARLSRPVVVVNSLGMKLVLLPPGAFTMGSPAAEEGRAAQETPHRVTLSKPLDMGATEVTQRNWMALMGKNPSFTSGDALPVDTVTWDEAVAFCRKLSAKEKARYRLPTEAEWEYACRAGSVTAFHTGSTISTAQANYDGNYRYAGGQKGVFRETATAVGQFPPNAWGLFDMHGNVWEWCADWHGPYPAGDARDPRGPAQGKSRVVRGGCWINFPAVCRAANRGDTPPGTWNFNFGFRVVREVD